MFSCGRISSFAICMPPLCPPRAIVSIHPSHITSSRSTGEVRVISDMMHILCTLLILIVSRVFGIKGETVDHEMGAHILVVTDKKGANHVEASSHGAGVRGGSPCTLVPRTAAGHHHQAPKPRCSKAVTAHGRPVWEVPPSFGGAPTPPSSPTDCVTPG
jgi:hypothetical protein